MHTQTDRQTDRNKVITITLSYRRALIMITTSSDECFRHPSNNILLGVSSVGGLSKLLTGFIFVGMFLVNLVFGCKK